MRVETIQEVEAGDPTLEIPWASPRDHQLRYIDLKSFPDKIENLRECRRHPPLARLLRKVNAAGLPFRTAKCDVWVTTRLTEGERLDFNMPFKVGSYLDLAFDRSTLSSNLESNLRLGKKLERSLRCHHVQAQMEISVRRCLFHPKNHWGYYLTIFLHAYGNTRSEAKREWSRAVDYLGDATLRVGQPFGRRPWKGQAI